MTTGRKLSRLVNRLGIASLSPFFVELQIRFFSRQVDPLLEEQFQTGRILAAISSRPGQVGRADGYILEGKELEFYIRKLKAKKGK